MKMAQQLAAAITDPLVRNKTQYLNAIAELSTGRIGSAMTAIEAIQSPFFKARASAMLGLYQTRDESYNKLAEETFNQARELTASLESPSEKLVIASELARFAARAGKHAEADTGFSDAMQLLGQLPETNDRDQPLAILATNQARALRFTDARQQLTNIRDASLAQITREKLADSEKLVQKINE